MKTSLIFLISIASLIRSGPAQIVTFSFTGSAGDETSFAADAQPANGSVSSMSRGLGLTATTSAGTFNAKSWTTGSAIGSDDYYAFSITPNSGAHLTLTSLVMDERRSSSGIRNWSVRSSLDSFASDLASFSVPDNDDTRTGQSTALGSAFQNLTASVEFRVYAFSAESGTGTWRIDNVVLNGTLTSTPEPHEYAAVAGVALLGFAAYRRFQLRREAKIISSSSA
ncbi:MAG: hypothetical protein FJ403_10030 [Verrucomicrobia bacterium]|nr:hypothetical protein [Verrucomicrobiota bacterium]